ncbi:MAG: hypothetical protein ACI8YQ_004611, partial [Polaribacter sp.]
MHLSKVETPRENARKSTDYQYVMISFRGKNEG